MNPRGFGDATTWSVIAMLVARSTLDYDYRNPCLSRSHMSEREEEQGPVWSEHMLHVIQRTKGNLHTSVEYTTSLESTCVFTRSVYLCVDGLYSIRSLDSLNSEKSQEMRDHHQYSTYQVLSHSRNGLIERSKLVN